MYPHGFQRLFIIIFWVSGLLASDKIFQVQIDQSCWVPSFSMWNLQAWLTLLLICHPIGRPEFFVSTHFNVYMVVFSQSVFEYTFFFSVAIGFSSWVLSFFVKNLSCSSLINPFIGNSHFLGGMSGETSGSRLGQPLQSSAGVRWSWNCPSNNPPHRFASDSLGYP